MKTKFAGHGDGEAQNMTAGEPGGQTMRETHRALAARHPSSFAGQRSIEVHGAIAGEPGGHHADEAHGPGAARHLPEFDGQASSDAQIKDAVDAPGQPTAETQLDHAGGDHLAGQDSAEAQMGSAGEGAGHGQIVAEAQRSVAVTSATITEIVETGRQNAFAIRQRMRVKQATLSHIARTFFGYHTGLTDAERKRAMDAATKLIQSIEKGEDHPAAFLVHATSAAAEPWLDIERRTEKALVKLARKLPAHTWAKEVRGFGELSFARIIAETGDLSGYANPGRVWKRLGLAVYDGKAQRRTRDAEKAVEQGYSPRRRSVVFVAFDPVIRAQSVPKESGGQIVAEAQCRVAVGAVGAGHTLAEAQSQVAGPYRTIYDTKKAEYLARGEAGEEGWTKLHADRAAKRYASKRLLRDLWAAWRDEVTGQTASETHASGCR